jgi:hypothetical protein
MYELCTNIAQLVTVNTFVLIQKTIIQRELKLILYLF